MMFLGVTARRVVLQERQLVLACTSFMTSSCSCMQAVPGPLPHPTEARTSDRPCSSHSWSMAANLLASCASSYTTSNSAYAAMLMRLDEVGCPDGFALKPAVFAEHEPHL